MSDQKALQIEALQLLLDETAADPSKVTDDHVQALKDLGFSVGARDVRKLGSKIYKAARAIADDKHTAVEAMGLSDEVKAKLYEVLGPPPAPKPDPDAGKKPASGGGPTDPPDGTDDPKGDQPKVPPEPPKPSEPPETDRLAQEEARLRLVLAERAAAREEEVAEQVDKALAVAPQDYQPQQLRPDLFAPQARSKPDKPWATFGQVLFGIVVLVVLCGGGFGAWQIAGALSAVTAVSPSQQAVMDAQADAMARDLKRQTDEADRQAKAAAEQALRDAIAEQKQAREDELAAYAKGLVDKGFDQKQIVAMVAEKRQELEATDTEARQIAKDVQDAELKRIEAEADAYAKRAEADRQAARDAAALEASQPGLLDSAWDWLQLLVALSCVGGGLVVVGLLMYLTWPRFMAQRRKWAEEAAATPAPPTTGGGPPAP